jgi:hypothetical protein
VPYTAPFIRRNFGFLFTSSGRMCFLIFLGAVCFGMISDSIKGTNAYNWCIAVGTATMVNSLFNCFVICKCVGGDPSPRVCAFAT